MLLLVFVNREGWERGLWVGLINRNQNYTIVLMYRALYMFVRISRIRTNERLLLFKEKRIDPGLFQAFYQLIYRWIIGGCLGLRRRQRPHEPYPI